MGKNISLRGVRTHNLKNIDVDLPRDKLVVITGLSGSGKSSLAFDTLYAEGQRRYVESLSAYARQFLSVMAKPDVDLIEGLSPAISIEQKAGSHNPRSTVGTITEIYDYCRLLYARVGQAICPVHQTVLEAQTISQMVDTVLVLPEETRIMVLSPMVVNRKGEHLAVFDKLRVEGFVRVRVDGKVYDLDEVPKLQKMKRHSIDVVIDRLRVRPSVQQRLAESLETATNLSAGMVIIDVAEQESLVLSARHACKECGYSVPELEPRLFSFNNPVGACHVCDGLGSYQRFDPEKVIHNAKGSLASGAIRGWDQRNEYYFQLLTSLAKHYQFELFQPLDQLPEKIQHILLHGSGDEVIEFIYKTHQGKERVKHHPFEGVLPIMERRYRETDSQAVHDELAKYLTLIDCDVCHGARLCKAACSVFIGDINLPELAKLSIEKAAGFFEQLELTGQRADIAEKIIKEIKNRLKFLIDVGLSYLSVGRRADTLSGGEAQRIRLASQIGSGLVGVMYILDEPSIGLHQRDNGRLISTLLHLRDLGNTVIVVEHDEEAMLTADYLIDMGPGAGVHGGQVVACGTPEEVKNNPQSLTGQYLSGQRELAIPKRRRSATCQPLLKIVGAHCNNLKNVNVNIPVGLFTCVTGVSGSGKSSLILDTLYPFAALKLNKATKSYQPISGEIEGLDNFDKIIDIDQSPIGRTPRSNPATYTGLLTPIRELFAGTQEARIRGYKPGRFSFNVKGGRCEACEGDGVMKVEMHFLADVYVTCDVCQTKRYNRETLEVKYKGKNIYEVLQMTIEEASDFFAKVPVIYRKLQTLISVGLSYVALGQSATTLSGGEAQRVKLSKELAKRSTGRTLYLLDEPTTGLHFADVELLLSVLLKLRDEGNTIIVIEHNLDVIKTADWVIDLGPDGGEMGGELVIAGTPEQVAKCDKSHTGYFLAKVLGGKSE